MSCTVRSGSLCSSSGKAAPQGTQPWRTSSEQLIWHFHITWKSTFALSFSTSRQELTLLTLILRQGNERTSELQTKILVDYSVSWIQQEFIPHFDMQNSRNQYWLRKKKRCPGRSKPWHCPGEKLQLWTEFWVLPKGHCSAAATRDWRSDKQVKK